MKIKNVLALFFLFAALLSNVSYCQEKQVPQTSQPQLQTQETPPVIYDILCQRARVKYPDKTEKVAGTIIRINFDRPVECKIYEISDPYRIIVDPSGDVLANFKERKIDLADGYISEISVVETQAPENVKIEKSYYPIDFIVISPKLPVKYKLVQQQNTACVYIGDIDESVDKR